MAPQLISISNDSSLHLWDVDTGRHLLSSPLGEHTDWVSTLAFSADSKYLVSDNAVEPRARVWNVETFTQHSILIPPQDVIGLSFSPDFKKLVGRVFLSGIHVWDAETKGNLFTLEGVDRMDNYWPLVFSPDGKILAGRGGATLLSNMVQLWQTDTGDQLFTLKGHTDVVSEYIFSPNSELFASGSQDGTIVLWDTKTGKSLLHLTGHTRSISALAFSVNSKTLASGAGNEIRLWEVNTGNPIGTFDAVENITALAFSPDGKTLASGSEAGLIQIWKSDQDYQIQATLKGHQDSVGVLMFSPDGKTLASGSYDGTILLWDSENFK